MNKICNTILAIILTITLMLSTTVTTFAADDRDPGGNSVIQLPYKILYISDNEIM